MTGANKHTLPSILESFKKEMNIQYFETDLEFQVRDKQEISERFITLAFESGRSEGMAEERRAVIELIELRIHLEEEFPNPTKEGR